ncbi:preprotein translocase subunit SecE [Sphingomonas morindae]|uniref:Protein translocase subunit SecE n=1 Tax=Sphingomonas morindae TaxID=1541170 RepID=A0ABY4XBU9_9SPHN|nr:preprotein translocase subunit SecE [Sphingomonas morindae]USI74442.1 preprotein translocase subunit SecE [Sphingomonas morindae]
MAARSTEEQGLGGAVRAIPEFVNQVKAETARVAWPTRRETLTTAVMVVVMTTILALFFFGVDQVFNLIVKYLLSLIG